MSPSSPVRTRQPRRAPEAESSRLPRAESVVAAVRSVLLVVAAVSVIGTSNYFAYLIGRKQASYEELRRQVDRVVHLMDQKQVKEDIAPATLKQRQDRLGQNGSADFTTSTINGKTTVVAPEPAPAERPVSAALIDAAPDAPPAREAGSPPRETSQDAVTRHRDLRAVAAQRGLRRQKVLREAPTDAFALQPGQSAPVASPDVGLAGQ